MKLYLSQKIGRAGDPSQIKRVRCNQCWYMTFLYGGKAADEVREELVGMEVVGIDRENGPAWKRARDVG